MTLTLGLPLPAICRIFFFFWVACAGQGECIAVRASAHTMDSPYAGHLGVKVNK